MNIQESTMRKPIKVCFVLLKTYAVFHPELGEELGGAEVQYYLLSRELAKNPHFEVHLVCRDYGQPDHEIVDGVHLHKIRQKPGPFRKIASAQALLKGLAHVDAAVYFQRCAAIETGLVAWHCTKHGKAFVYSSAHDKDVNPATEKVLGFWTGTSFRYGIKHADFVICQNQFQLDQVRSRWGLTADIIPNMVSHIAENPTPGDQILWVGRAIPTKRPEVFLDLARKHPRLPFRMILSAGPDREYHRKIFAEAQTMNHLVVEKFIPYQEIEDVYRKARLLVSTSEYEGFSNTFLEAMKFGVPILSLHVDTDGIFSRNQTGLFAENDENLFEQQFERILNDPRLYQTLSQNALDYVRHRHDLRSILPKYEELILSLSHADGAPPLGVGNDSTNSEVKKKTDFSE